METQDQQQARPIVSNQAYRTFASLGLNNKEATVDQAKAIAAQLWDVFNSATNEPGTDGGRMYAIAKNKLEESVMWFVKGISRSGN